MNTSTIIVAHQKFFSTWQKNELPHCHINRAINKGHNDDIFLVIKSQKLNITILSHSMC